jgi:23S rRNA (adenine2503-C2)-methyltransferase
VPVIDKPSFPPGFRLSGQPKKDLESILAPLPRFRSEQIFHWMELGVLDFDKMINIPLALRGELKEKFPSRPGVVEAVRKGRDTLKLGILFEDGIRIEAVMLTDGKKRRTACLSTQAGCPVHCVFCRTGSLGFERNLSSSEIAEQFLFLRAAAEKEGSVISNIVIMGMGEPLLNLPELRKALEAITEMNFSGRRITVSTCGIAQGIDDLCQNGPHVRLALSLATGDEGLRQKLMPGLTMPLEDIKQALIRYQRKSGKRITLEVVLLSGINTGRENAGSVALFARGLDAMVNIIPYNHCEGLTFEEKTNLRPSESEIEY